MSVAFVIKDTLRGRVDEKITWALILYVERGQALEARPKLPQNSICMPFKCWRGVCGVCNLASKHDQPCLRSRVPTHRLGLVASRRFSTIRLSLSTYMPHLNTVSLDTQIHYLCQSNQVNSPPSSCASRERCVLSQGAKQSSQTDKLHSTLLHS